MELRDVIDLCSSVAIFLLGMFAQFKRVDVGQIRAKLELALGAIEALQAVANGLLPQVSVPDKVGLSKASGE